MAPADDHPEVIENDASEPLLLDHQQGMESSAQDISGREAASLDAAVARRVLKKIDRVIIPLLFVTYMLNFMDKIILSSAAVFGLPEDTVRRPGNGTRSTS